MVDILQGESEAVADHGPMSHSAIAEGPEISSEVHTVGRYN